MRNVLFGVVCLDIYTRTGRVRPGCGILHNSFHLQRLGCQPLLITRIGQQQADHFLNFFQRHQISVLAESLVAPGESASIQIEVQPSGEAVMSNFKLGVWENFRLTPTEEMILSQAAHLHTVLVPPVWPEFLRLGRSGKLAGLSCVSADFLSFVDFTPERLAQFLPYLDVAFIGWKGKLNDPILAAIRQMAAEHQVLVVITLGERGVQVFDARPSGTDLPGQTQVRFFEVEKVEVEGNTNGCGDAFIAHFLAGYWPDHQLEAAISGGMWGGAQATRWQFALPDEVY